MRLLWARSELYMLDNPMTRQYLEWAVNSVFFDRNTSEQESDADIMQMCLWNTALINAIVKFSRIKSNANLGILEWCGCH
jgi:hypothetical protein